MQGDQGCDFDQHPGVCEGAVAGNLTPGYGWGREYVLK